MLRAAIARGLSALLLGLALPVSAQSFQSSFSEVKFDRSKGSATLHAGVQVDAASGAASMSVPFGPGIGQRGLGFRPTFSMRVAPQLGISNSLEESIIGYVGSSGLAIYSTSQVDHLYQRGWGSATFSPGTFDLPLVGGQNAAYALQANYSLPGGAGGSGLGTVPAGMTEAAANALIKRFGYSSNVVVSNTAGSTARTGKPRLIQMGSTGHLILGLKVGPAGDAITDEVSDYVGFSPGPSKWDFPRKMLVIQGDVAYEYSYVNHRYISQARSYLPVRNWLFSAHYMITKVMNRFGESLSFVYDNDGIGYTASWSTNPSVKLRVQVLSTTSVSTTLLGGNGQGTTAPQYTVQVSYQGISTPVSTYTIGITSPVGAEGAGGVSTGDRATQPVPSPAGPPSSVSASTAPGGQWSQDGNWDDFLTSAQPLFITQDTTGERIDFTYAAGATQSWGNDNVTPPVLSQVKTSTRTVNLTWNPYKYKISYSPSAWGSYSNAVAPRRPAFSYGVTQVSDTDGQQKRYTMHTRQVPQANWLTGPPPTSDSTPEVWVSTAFYDAIQVPDGLGGYRVEVHKFVQPYAIDNLSSADGNMQYLAYLKHVECEVRYYESGVDWQSDQANPAGSSSTAYKVVVKDRFSLHTTGNAGGTFDKYGTPYPTRTRTWDKDSQMLLVEETTDFDAVNLGWTTFHKTSNVVASPNLSTEMRSLQSQGLAYSAYPAAQGGERKTQKTLEAAAVTVPEWFIGRVVNESPTNQQDNTQFLAAGVTLPLAQPPVAKVFDPAFNTLTSATEGAAGDTQVTTTFTYQGTSGLLAGQLQSVLLSGAGLDSSGFVGVWAYGYDSNGFLNSINQKPNSSTTLSSQQAQDELGRPTSQTDANGKVHTFTWDGVGRLTAITPPDGDVATSIAYPDLRTVTLTRGAQVSEFRFNGFGDLILERRQDVNGAWSFRLHGINVAGQVIGETVWMAGHGDTQEADWTKPNLTASATTTTTSPGPDRCVQWGWDDAGNRVCIQTQPTTITTTTTSPALYGGSSVQFDKRGRVILATDANGITVKTDYLGAANAPVVSGYSPTYVGPIKKVTVAPGTPQAQVTYYESDGIGRLVRVTDALGQRTEYRYDSADRILQVSQFDAAGHVQQRGWTYNSLGWLTSLTQPESGLTSYSDFTVAGKPKTTSYAGRIVRAAFDWMGRPLSVVSDDGTVNQSFIYDSAPGGLGKLASSSDGGANGVNLAYSYAGPGNRLSSLITTARGQSFTQSFGYDPYGNRTSGNTSHGAWAQSFHPATGAPNVLSYGSTTVASTPWANYDPVSWQILQIAYGNGVKSTFTYDTDQARLTSIAHLPASGGPLAQWAYVYDPVGNLVKENDLISGSFDQYGYDNLNRLVSALLQSPTYGDQLQSFSYDAFGNRISGTTQKVTGWVSGTRGSGTATVTASSVPTIINATFDSNSADLWQNNRLPAATTSGAATGRLYDPQGNLTQIWTKPGDSTTQLTMTYDALGRVTTLGNSKAGTTETYAYTAEGLRTVVEVRQSGALQKTKFNLYNDGRQMVSQWELVPAGALTWKRDVLYLGSREAAEFDSAGMHVTQVDQLGSPRVVTGPTGVVESRQKYMPFGELLEQVGNLKTAKGYTGHEQTDDSGLIYMQARFYLPMYGRFATPDPARDQHFEITQSWNIYSYVRNSPIMHTDPTGMNTEGSTSEPAGGQGSPSVPQSTSPNHARDASGNQHPNVVNIPLNRQFEEMRIEVPLIAMMKPGVPKPSIQKIGVGRYKVRGVIVQFQKNPDYGPKVSPEQASAGMDSVLQAILTIQTSESWKALQQENGGIQEINVVLNNRVDAKTYSAAWEDKSKGVFTINANPFLSGMSEVGTGIPVPLHVAIFHELGHSVETARESMSASERREMEERNVSRWENRYRKEFGIPNRNGYSELIMKR